MPSKSIPIARRATKAALWISLWGMFVSNVTLTVLTVALPYIARDLHADRNHTNWVSLGPMLVVALCTPAAGRAADAYGRKRLWLAGFALALLGMAASALAPSLAPLLFARVVTGIGTAMLVPAALAIITDLYPPGERATPIGYWTSTVAMSPLAGVLIGGALLDVMSWRWLFVAQVAIGLPAWVAAYVGFEERTFPVQGRFDWEGSLSIGSAALAVMLAATWAGSAGLDDPSVLTALACAAAAALWAVRAERRAAQPVMPPWLVRDPLVSLSLVARLALTFSYMGAFMILPYLLKELWHLSAFTISALLIWRPLAMGLTGPLAGMLSPRFGAARLVLWGGYCILAASVLSLWLGEEPDRLLLAMTLVIAGVGLGLCAPGSVAVVTERVGSELLGTVSSMMTLNATLANALGMAVMFAVVETQGGVQSAAAYHASFRVGTALAAVGVLAAHLLSARSAAASKPLPDSGAPLEW